jgi:tol-pal system protein YbgF
MLIDRMWWLGMFLALASIGLTAPPKSMGAQSPPQSATDKKPFDLTEIEKLLKGSVTPKRVATLVGKYGVSFELTEDVEKEIRELGADGELLLVISKKRVQPAPNVTPPTPSPQAPLPGVLYDNALRDYNAGRYDLASQQFRDYMKFYANTDLAGNAQFYLAEIEYRQWNFEQAVRDYDKLLEQFPGGNKALAAQLKKGYALLELRQRDAGVRELNSLVQRYPRSIEATQARERLKKLGATH